MHILDIVQNSVAAQANFIKVIVQENIDSDTLEIIIIDNGKGMEPTELAQVVDPFFTSRTTRKVGLGIPLFKANAEACNGTFTITSEKGQGTQVWAVFQYSHIDRVPLGDMVGTIITIISGNPHIKLIFEYSFNTQKFLFNTEEVKENIEDVPLNNPLVLEWLREYLRENINNARNI